MYLDRIYSAVPDSDLIAPSAASAALWESLIVESGPDAIAGAWPSPDIHNFDHWLRMQWDRCRPLAPELRERSLLSEAQTTRLWQRVVDESDAGKSLISTAGIAAWAHDASRVLHEHSLPPERAAGDGWPGDSDAFPAWLLEFDRRLNASGWQDPDRLLYTLNRTRACRPDRHLLLLDPPRLTPEMDRLREHWRSAGRDAGIVFPAGLQAMTQALTAANPADELQQVIAWVARHLDAAPKARVAVVVPDLAQRRDEIELTIAERIGHDCMTFPSGRPISDIGIFGAALTALRLLTPGAGFDVVSRWLRSPFFDGANRDYRQRAVGFECRLREDPRLQHCFLTAYRHYGLQAEFRQHLPEAAARLSQVSERLPRQASPTGWAASWQSCLRLLAWDGFATGLPESLCNAWDAAWSQFAELTPVTGTLGPVAALAEFEHQARQQMIFEPARLTGVHLFSSIRDVGPGFAGAWICGFSDRGWPERVPSNPLLPRIVRARYGLPGATPNAELEAGHAELKRLLERVPEAIFSCPLRVLDQPQVPNSRFEQWLAGSNGETAKPHRVRPFEEMADPAPPLVGEVMPGGVRTLDLQSACPVRAFAVARLGAEPLQRPARGIAARLRGTLLHRALELLYRDPDKLHAPGLVADCAARAIAELAPAGDDNWEALIDSEKSRMIRVLEAFLAAEATRQPFIAAAVERKTEISLAGMRFRCRIDRMDQLADGRQLLIDYKSGRQHSAGWFQDRLGDTQLPLYAMNPDLPVAAIVLISVNDTAIDYRAAGVRADAVPGRQRVMDDSEWPAQLQRWKEQLGELVAEFAAGDVRIRRRASELADGPYAALTRIRYALQ